MMRPQVGFVSLGCPKNLVDTERMMGLLSKEGILITGEQTAADVVVINTCGFLDPAKQESMDTIREFVGYKKKKKLKGVVVTGCMTERYLGLMREAYPEVDVFLQTKDFSKITEVVWEISRGEKDKLQERLRLLGEAEVLSGHSELTDFVERAPGVRSFAYVKIAEGCNRVCSFCIIPKLRGKLHSRSISGIVDEVKQLVGHGTREVIFIAQDLTSYGRDLGDQTSLLELLQEIETIEGLEWFRLMYNYPRFFSDDLIRFLATSKKFSRYLDIPFQHISDNILKLMKRPESRQEIYELVRKLRASIPDLFLRTTVMVGFPGETEDDFSELLNFIEDIQFDHLGAFTFWREPNTPSYDLPNQVSDEVKTDRYDQLMKVQLKIQKSRLERLVGQLVRVRIDAVGERTKNGQIYIARHGGQAPEIDGICYILSEVPLSVGSVVEAHLHKIVGDYDYFGEFRPNSTV